MARHRDIRNMDYSDDYDGYDDVYGHSVDDDYYISPSNRQFIYNRELSQRSSEGDIKEEDELEAELSDTDRAKLASCIDQIKHTLGSTSISRNDLINIIIKQKFDIEKSIKSILEDSKQQIVSERDYNQLNKFQIKLSNTDSTKQFNIPNIFNKSNTDNIKFNIPNLQSSSNDKPTFKIPNIFNADKPKFTIPNLHKTDISSTSLDGICTKNCDISNENNIKRFDTLSDFVGDHFKNKSEINSLDDIRTKVENLQLKENITSKLTKLALSDTRSSSNIPTNSKSSFQIDLSVALKNINSAPLVLNTTEKESFNIPFIDCEPLAVSQKNIVHKETLTCTLNIIDYKNMLLTLEKKNSSFGKVICKKYKKHKKIFQESNSNWPTNIKRFDFSTLSPDSRRAIYLKR